MKFSNGQWLDREGYSVYCPAEARDVKQDGNKLVVYAPHKKVNHRGDTLGGPLLTYVFSSPIPDIIKVTVFHYRDYEGKQPEFNNFEITHNESSVEINDNEAVFASGKTSARIGRDCNFNIKYTYEEKPLTTSNYKNFGYIIAPDKKTYMREQLNLDVDECVYGLGERFTHFVKNGQTVEVWNEDGGTNSEQSYKNIPFYITNKGYGVFVNHPERVSFEVASEKVEQVQFSVEGEYLEYYIIGGASMKEVLKNYTTLTGKPALPPAWSFGLWLTTSFTTSYDEGTVNSFIDGMLNRDIPLSVFHFDCFWMKEFQWCNFEWDSEVFPDPKGMLGRLKDKGLKVCVWINPYIAQKSKLFEEGMKNGYLVKRQDGRVWQWDMWQSGMGLVDFTNPEACSWYASKLKALLDLGVDCFKTDFGERIPTDVVYFDGSDPNRMHNYYTYLYNKTVFEIIKQERGENEACLFARSATVGGQQFPVHWGGDCNATYPSMAESLRGGLSLGLSGFGFWSHDISGFENTATPDIYKRWSAFGLLSSHSRLHGNNSYRVPWLFDGEAVEVVKFFTKLKCSLMPYLFRNAVEASKSGIPVMRPMIMEFEEDACNYLDRQYMLGDSLLVAPIFNDRGEVSYYLPEGKWTNFITGESLQGGGFKKEKHGYLSLPLMVRPNSIIAVGSKDNKPDYDYSDGVTLHVFELEEGKSTSTTIYNIEGNEELKVDISHQGDAIEIRYEGHNKPFSIIFRGIDNFKSVEGAACLSDKLGARIIPSDGVQIIKCLF